MGLKDLRKLVLALFMMGSILPAAARASADAKDTVERLNATLLQVMQQADQLGYQGRYETLAPVLTESFNFPVMARISLGKHWRNLSNEQKRELTQVFARLSVATFASRFDGYSGERFQVRGEEPRRKGTMLVDNVLIKTSGETIPINYAVREFDGTWRIVDVYLDAKYSELAL
ncbi:MAG: ABC transporter substrate-binding protein, partial [Kiloniellales bacterium]|nr:ABC transporter substrate-binding protein [Kiloniellales bacterium]